MHCLWELVLGGQRREKQQRGSFTHLYLPSALFLLADDHPVVSMTWSKRVVSPSAHATPSEVLDMYRIGCVCRINSRLQHTLVRADRHSDGFVSNADEVLTCQKLAEGEAGVCAHYSFTVHESWQSFELFCGADNGLMLLKQVDTKIQFVQHVCQCNFCDGSANFLLRS